MLLQPRKFKQKHRQKKRIFQPFTSKSLHYGDSGLLILQPLRLPAKHIYRLKLYLKKATKRADFTKRLIWFNIFPHLPLTKKSKGIRMGKGVGKLATWVSYLRAGAFIFELKNLRLGRTTYFLKQIAFKLPVKSVCVSPTPKLLNLSATKGVNPAATYYF